MDPVSHQACVHMCHVTAALLCIGVLLSFMPGCASCDEVLLVGTSITSSQLAKPQHQSEEHHSSIPRPQAGHFGQDLAPSYLQHPHTVQGQIVKVAGHITGQQRDHKT